MKSVLLFLMFWSSISGASAFEERGRWSKNRIHVCFMDKLEQVELLNIENAKNLYKFEVGITSTKIRSHISWVVSQNFTIEKTGVEFYGWGVCSKAHDFDVIIFELEFPLFSNSKIGGIASTGFEISILENRENRSVSVVDSPGKKAFFGVNELASAKIIHEMGHVLGLHHEHDRIEVKADLNYKGVLFSNAPVSSSRSFWGEFDPISIMGHHQYSLMTRWQAFKTDEFNLMHERNLLSPGDRAVLKYLFQGAPP